MTVDLPPTTELTRTDGGQAVDVAATLAAILDRVGWSAPAKRAGVGAALLPVEAVPPAAAPTKDAEAPATLEEEADRWDAATASAARVAEHLRGSYAERKDVTAVEHNGDRVVITLAITGLGHWFGWLASFNADHERYFERPGGLMAIAQGEWAQTHVTLRSPDVADLVTAAADTARRPVWVDNRLYDMAVPLVDATGVAWKYTGEDAHDGVPLISQGGMAGRLDAVARSHGITPYLGEQPEAKPEPDADADADENQELSPAGELALRLGDMPTAAGIDGYAVMAPTALEVRVHPETAENWAWWLDLFGIAHDRITRNAGNASGTGERDGVTVALTGLDAAELPLGGGDDE